MLTGVAIVLIFNIGGLFFILHVIRHGRCA